MKSLHIKKGDRVKVITGKDKGTVGEVLDVYPESNRVKVHGVNIVKRHLRDRANQPQSGRVNKGGIIASEAPIHASNVQLVTDVGGKKDVVTRVGHAREAVTKRRPDGSEYTSSRTSRVLLKGADQSKPAGESKQADKKQKEADK